MAKSNVSRRTFVGTAAAIPAGWTALSASSVLAANEKIRLGFIGVGNRGMQVLNAFLQPKHSDMEVVAVCDVFEPYLDRAKQKLGARVAAHADFREVLDRKDVDAVVVATPDHWHAIQTIDACKAGKDVYVEKPLAVTVREGRRMVEVARETKRVVTVGTHRRSSKAYAKLAEMAQSDTFGKITVARSYRLSNMTPNGIGRAKPSDPPANLNWDMWLGPRPMRPYQDNIAPYKFRWWDLYSSQMTNWGIHYIDAIRWATGEGVPASVCAMGGRFVVDDDRTIPDTMEAIMEFASGRLIIFGQYEASNNPAMPRGELELRGPKGTAYVDGHRIDVIPERGGQFGDPKQRMEPINLTFKEPDPTIAHARNFLDCIKSRNKPAADVEEGHLSTTCSLLANISLATKSRIEWDAKKEECIGNEAANQLLHYEYRKPWKLG